MTLKHVLEVKFAGHYQDERQLLSIEFESDQPLLNAEAIIKHLYELDCFGCEVSVEFVSLKKPD